MRKRKSMLSAIILAAATLAGSTVLPATASAAAPSVTVSGTVTASGTAAAGVTVTIHAWPDQAVEQALKVAQNVPWTLVGTATTDASGHFSVSLPVAQLAPEATYGVVNLEADSSAGSTTFPVVISRNGGNSFMPAVPAVHIAGKRGKWYCHGVWQLQKQLGAHWATVGETYVPGKQAKQGFTYQKGQSSVTGTGFSVSGDVGSFGDYGTWGVSATFKEPFGTESPRHSYFWRTKFYFGEYHCNLGEGIYHGHLIHTDGYFGGATTSTPPRVPATPKKYCAFQKKHSAPQSNNSSSVTFVKNLAIDTGDGLEFQASVQTGFDTSAQLTYTFLYNGNLCGQVSAPGRHPRQLVVHSGTY
jgi:hypothetical protein